VQYSHFGGFDLKKIKHGTILSTLLPNLKVSLNVFINKRIGQGGPFYMVKCALQETNASPAN
jgi:hypothetical protein